jgi:nucleoside-triphosphatase
MDDIGKLELRSPRFVSALEAALQSRKPILGSILQASHPWTDALKRRAAVDLYRLTAQNCEHLKDAILARLLTEVRE